MASALSTEQFSDRAEVTEFVVNKGHGVKGLAETGIKFLPDPYIQTAVEQAINKSLIKETDESIPVIDMSNPDENKVAEAICEAAEKWGFFQVINHGVPIDVLDNIMAATHRFFALPAEEKIKFAVENSMSPDVKYSSSFYPVPGKPRDWVDYLRLFSVNEPGASQFWPDVCRNEVLEYRDKTMTLVKKLAEYLVKNLNVKELDETKESIIGSTQINLNYYPICPNPDLAAGVGCHYDVSLFTVLLQDNVGGLNALSPLSGNWIHVPPIPGSFVVNIGDAMQTISNHRYKSAEHRALANGKYERISVPMFVNPKLQSVIDPLSLSELPATGEIGIEIPGYGYRHLMSLDYREYVSKRALDEKKSIDVAKI